MKKKLFIGSSKESIKIAEQVKAYLVKECSEWLEVSMWNENGIFELNKSTLDNLKDFSRRYDYGVFIADADDKLWFRRKKYKVSRDNVTFELGMFIGALGLNRAFILASEKIKLPSDMNGNTIPFYKGECLKKELLQNLVANIEKTRDSYRIGHRQSSALAYGYFNNFVKPLIHALYNQSSNCHLHILIPTNIYDLCYRIKKYKETNHTISTNVDGMMIHSYSDKRDSYWDIPRQLKTLEELVRFYNPCSEPGKNMQYEEELQNEVQNYFDVLQYLVENECAVKENITISQVKI